MARIPYARVEAIIDDNHSATPTPTTLSGNSRSIYSYAKQIAWQERSGRWCVVDRQSSRTTNRHITAVALVLEQRGMCPVTVDYHTGEPV